MKKGFTILETMVAVSLFIVVVMYGMGTLLSANVLHKKSQDQQSIMDNLSFVMEEMSRNLRTGYTYHCIDNNDFTVSALNTPRSCASGGGISFEESVTGSFSNQNDQWVYKISSTDGGATFSVSKSVNSGATWVVLNPDEVKLTNASGFSVLGAEAPASDGSGNHQQPFVNIRLVGSIVYKGVTTPFSLQTSVSQRLIDVGQ
jgi:type II secretory pathway pseudopilin PulG